MDFLIAALQPINLPYTILMAVVALYWLSVIIGVLDFDTFDIDLDADADIEVDGEIGAMAQVLHYFNIGELPLMIIFSFWFLFMWVGSVLTNHYLGNDSWLIAGAILIPNAFVSLMLTKYATKPFQKAFSHLTKEEDTSVIGKECKLIIPASLDKKGQAEVYTSGYHQRVYVKPLDDKKLQKGDTALIIEFDEQQKCYLIEPLATLN
ncbi:hypothetical protein V6R21_13820 [Limibacter armeniacum]|uniref:hypothetical protein n=1 Tax=Limibacter armeniacum TaxID=466084 RepID=UPI002FE51543